MKQTDFCHFRSFFALSPPNDPDNQNLERMKKMPGNIILLHMCTINATDRIFCHSGPFFALSPPDNPENQICKKHMCTLNDNHMMYGSQDMECNFVILDQFLPFYPLWTQKIKILKT